jgi:carbonic anhydrase
MDIIYRYDPFEPLKLTAPGTAAEALNELRHGNRRFAEMVARMQARTEGAPAGEPLVFAINPISLGLPIVSGYAPPQTPFALVINCSDARVSTESVFDQSFNNLFVVRVAGNVLGTELLGSIHFAVKHLSSLRIALVLGHTECGAVSAAVDAYLAPEAYADIAFSYPLRSLVDRLQVAVRTAAKSLEQIYGVSARVQPNFRTALRDMAVYLNAAITAYDLARELPSTAEAPLEVVFAVYDISTVSVQAHPDGPDGGVRSFASAPTTSAAFVELVENWSRSDAIAEMLN